MSFDDDALLVQLLVAQQDIDFLPMLLEDNEHRVPHRERKSKASPRELRLQAIRQSRRRARMAEADGEFAPEEWEALKAKYGYSCLRCRKQEPDIKLTVDHVIPILKGGSNTLENIQPLCKSCNDRKGTKRTDYRTRWEQVTHA